MKPNDVTSDSYAEYNVDSNEKDSKIKVRVHVGFGACPQIMVAKSSSGVKYHINIEYKGKNFFLILTVSRAKMCPDLGIRPKNLGKKKFFFFRIAKCYMSLEPETYEEFHFGYYFKYKIIISSHCHKYKDSPFKEMHNANADQKLALDVDIFHS